MRAQKCCVCRGTFSSATQEERYSLEGSYCRRGEKTKCCQSVAANAVLLSSRELGSTINGHVTSGRNALTKVSLDGLPDLFWRKPSDFQLCVNSTHRQHLVVRLHHKEQNPISQAFSRAETGPRVLCSVFSDSCATCRLSIQTRPSLLFSGITPERMERFCFHRMPLPAPQTRQTEGAIGASSRS